jgi:hypothetical protein
MSWPERSELVKYLAVIVGLGTLTIGMAIAGESSPSANPNEQLPPGAMQEKATEACSSCHEARIIVQQRLSKAAWTKEVDKMTKWGAGVDAKDRDALIDYLSANFSPDQPAYLAPKSASGSVSASQIKPQGKTKK